MDLELNIKWNPANKSIEHVFVKRFDRSVHFENNGECDDSFDARAFAPLRMTAATPDDDGCGIDASLLSSLGARRAAGQIGHLDKPVPPRQHAPA